jgi:hypothetical protein
VRVTGALALVLGAIALLYGLSMETAVKVPRQDFGFGIFTPEMTVNNLGLMDEKRTVLMLSGLSVLVGVLCLGFSRKDSELSRRSHYPPRCTQDLSVLRRTD